MSRIAILLGLLAGISGSGSSATSVALPQLTEDLSLDPHLGSWVLASYGLTMAVTTALYGRIVDRFGIRAPLCAGVVLTTVGGALAALSPNLPMIVAARLLQGCGGGAAPVVTLAAIHALYSGRQLIRALALWTTAGVGITAAGPLLGGVATEVGGWRAAVLLPALSSVVLFAIWRAIPAERSRGQLDLAGALWVVGLSGGLMLLVQSPARGSTAALTAAVLILVCLPLVVRQVQRRPDGFVPLSVIREPVVLGVSLACSTIYMSWYALMVVIPLTLTARGWSPIAIGAGMLPGAMVGVGGRKIVIYAVARLGGPPSVALATGLCSLALMLAVAGSSYHLPLPLLVAIALVYLAMTIGQPALTSAIIHTVPLPVLGIALGLSTLVTLSGGGLGAAVAGLSPILGQGGVLALLSGVCATAAAAVLVYHVRVVRRGDPAGRSPRQVGPDDLPPLMP